MSKGFKTLDEQLEILKSKGLIIEEEEEAKEILLRENYFFVNGYRLLLMNSRYDKSFVVGSTFRELYAIFSFDRYIRNIVFKNLLIIENNLKSIISYQMSKKYGVKERDYLNVKNFSSDKNKIRRIKDLIEKMKRQIRVNASKHMATIHYSKNYGYIPLWVVVKVLSFGIVCDLFTILKKEDQIEIAEFFNTSTYRLNEYLPILANYRNLCAHEDILFYNKTEKYIGDTEYHNKLNILKMDDEYIYGKNDLFALILILKQLQKKDDFIEMLKEIEYEIEKLSGRLNSISIDRILDQMGFPRNYIELIDM